MGKTRPPSSQLRAVAVHPHMRGENFCNRSSFARIRGTPPHAWGKLHERSQPGVIRPVHPHMRGENFDLVPVTGGYEGTPPHAWGKRWLGRRRSGAGRYTPTCVGKTVGVAGRVFVHQVHPHMRGENPCCLKKTCYFCLLFSGIRMSFNPSASTTSLLVSPYMRISNFCSVLADQI